MISIKNVSKSFGPVQAVKDVSLEIAQGEFFSLLGASGSGKTTLLRTVAGFEAVSDGLILIDGVPMQDTPPHRRPIKMVFQNYAIFPHLNVRDNIGYGLRRLAIPRAQQADMIEEALDMIKLPGFGDRRASQLSGGQMQRVALARALILKPKVLLLDEPLGALDKQLRQQMQLELRLLQKSVGITFVLVTHDQEEALTLSDKIAVMSAGKVLQVDTPAGLYDRPRNREVASFIGNMNFFAGRVSKIGTATAEIETEGLGHIQVKSGTLRKELGARVFVAVRPEKFGLSLKKPNSGQRSVPGTVVTSVYLGESHHFYVKIDGRNEPVAISMHSNWGTGLEQVNQGRNVWASWNDEAFVVLDND